MENKPMKNEEVIALINSTEKEKVINLLPVKQKFIRNYEQANGIGKGELAYQKNAIYFQNRLKDSGFSNVSPMAVYKTWIMVAIRGYDLDPTAGEVYIMPYGKTIDLQRQAPYMVRRLIETKQIKFCYPVQLVYDGDDFEVNMGAVTKHIRKFNSNKIKAGYVKMDLLNGKEIYFIYTPANWNAWKKKSPQQESENWTKGEDGQPVEAFLKTKIVKHACSEKCFASGNRVITEDFFPEVEEQEAIAALKDGEAEAEVQDIEHKEVQTQDEF